MIPSDYGAWTKLRTWDSEHRKWEADQWFPGWIEPVVGSCIFYMDGKVISQDVAMVEDMWESLAKSQETT